MRKEIQPKTNTLEAKCSSCDTMFTVKSTMKSITVDICSNCHAFYTGKKTSSSSKGRIEQFNKKFNRESNN